MKNKTSYFTSSRNTNRYFYQIYLADVIKNLWNITTNDDDDDDDYNVQPLLNFPPSITDYKLKNKRMKMECELKKRLNGLYNEGKDILEIKRSISNSNSMQTKYAFTYDFRNIILKSVEVNCRMITTNMANQGMSSSSSSSSSYSPSYNLSRIGNITFKGEMKMIIEELMEKCKRELEEKYKQKVNEIKSAAMYIPEHNDNLCGWKCVTLEKYIKRDAGYSSFFKLEENNSRYKPICYYKRQLIGQEIIPFIDEEDEEEEEEEKEEEKDEGNLISCKQNEYIFDNLFYMKNELCGIKKYFINFTPNFLNTVDRDECAALLGFTLDYVGITAGRINLYLKPLPGHNIIYCTNVSSSSDLPKASSFLQEKLFTDKKVVEILEKKHYIKIPKYIKEYIAVEEEEEEEEKDNRKRKNNNNSNNNE